MIRIKLDLSAIGIIEGDDKRALENYVDVRCFDQRKNYDEYYINTDNHELIIDIKDLMILAENFIVKVGSDAVYLDVTL